MSLLRFIEEKIILDKIVKMSLNNNWNSNIYKKFVKLFNIISIYAPHSMRPETEKEQFYKIQNFLVKTI